MSINQRYSTWFQRVGQLWPDERITRLRNFAWLVVGISLSRSVCEKKCPAAGKTRQIRFQTLASYHGRSRHQQVTGLSSRGGRFSHRYPVRGIDNIIP